MAVAALAAFGAGWLAHRLTGRRGGSDDDGIPPPPARPPPLDMGRLDPPGAGTGNLPVRRRGRASIRKPSTIGMGTLGGQVADMLRGLAEAAQLTEEQRGELEAVADIVETSSADLQMPMLSSGGAAGAPGLLDRVDGTTRQWLMDEYRLTSRGLSDRKESSPRALLEEKAGSSPRSSPLGVSPAVPKMRRANSDLGKKVAALPAERGGRGEDGAGGRTESPRRSDSPRRLVRREFTPPPGAFKRLSGSGPERAHSPTTLVEMATKGGNGLESSSSFGSSPPSSVAAALEGRGKWGFDVMAFVEAENAACGGAGHPLVRLGMAILEDHGLFAALGLPKDKTERFLRCVEVGYNAVPYHNVTHACDVLQTLNFLVTNSGLEQSVTDLELLALLVAAVVHDVQHPGVNNNYIVATGGELALRYNDKSVLENHHASVAFALLSNPDLAFVGVLPKPDQVEFRKLVISLVLQTDMADHFGFVTKFKAKVNSGLDFDDAEERVDVFKMILKCADISNCAKPLDIALKWPDLVLEEFCQQGDRERAQGLPISAMCDRGELNKPKTQVDFINFIVQPTYDVLGKYLPVVREVCLPCIEQTKVHWNTVLQAEQAVAADA